MRNEKLTMKNGKKIAGLAFFTFLFSLFLFGCLNPLLDTPRTAKAAAGMGYFALTINGANDGRTIMPATVQDDFVKYKLDFFNVGETDTPVKSLYLDPKDLTFNQLARFIELRVGSYDLVVTAYVEFDETDELLCKIAAVGNIDEVNITAGNTTGGEVWLKVIQEGSGTFSWEITFPEGATAEMTIVPMKTSGLTPRKELILVDTPDEANEKEVGKTDSIELLSGSYRVTFDLKDEADRKLQRSEILHVYQNMTSHFKEDFLEEYFIIKRITKVELVTATVQTGIELPLVAKITPDDATFQNVTWSVGARDGIWDPDNTKATVEDGVFLSYGANSPNSKVKVLAIVEHGRGYMVDYIEELEVTVTFVQVMGMTLSPASVTMKDGTKSQITATMDPPNATNKALNWTMSQPGFITIDPFGEVTALMPTATATQGRVRATATSASNGGIARNIDIIVESVPITNITLSASTVYLARNGTVKLAALFAPPNATNKTLVWSSDDARFSVDQTGLVTAQAAANLGDYAKIYVKGDNGAIEKVCTVQIDADASIITGIALQTSSMRLAMGSTATLVPTLTPANPTPSNPLNDLTKLWWATGDDLVAAVSSTGVITPIQTGLVTIAVTTQYGGKIATCEVDIYDPAVDGPALIGFILSPATLTMEAWDKEQITPFFLPENAADQTVTWRSSNTAVATVTSTGQVEAIAPGEAVITAVTRERGLISTAAVKVDFTPVTKIVLNTATLWMTGSLSVRLYVTVYPFNASDKTLTWSSDDTDVATVSTNGTVVFNAAGTSSCEISVKSNNNPDLEEVCFVMGRNTSTAPTAVTGVSLHTTAISIAKGNTRPLNPTRTPANAENDIMYWYSDNINVATVDAEGKVTGVNPGTANIMVMTQDRGRTATCAVTVYEGNMATGVTLSTERIDLTTAGTVGRTATLYATVAGYGSSAANAGVAGSGVFWRSLSTAIATVSTAAGTSATSTTVSAVAEGETTIIATSREGGYVATCTVKVVSNNITVTGIRLNTTALRLEEGNGAELVSYLAPVGDYSDILWFSTNPAVVSIADPYKGSITAESVGTATIRASTVTGGFTATCSVTVRPKGNDGPAVTGVELNTMTWNMATNTQRTLLAFVKPVENDQIESTAFNKTIYWSSSNTAIATVGSGTGVVTSTGTTGSVNIMATTQDGGHKRVCAVTVSANGGYVTGASMNMSSLTLNMRTNASTEEISTGTISSVLSGTNVASYAARYWYITNPEVATLTINSAGTENETCTVTAKAVGRATLYMTTRYGNNVRSIDVTVVPAGTGDTPPPIQAVGRVQMPATLTIDYLTPYKIPVTVLPANAANKELIWTSSAPGIIDVDESGEVTALSPGIAGATITVRTVDGGKTNSCTIKIKVQESHVRGHTTGSFYMTKYPMTQEHWQTIFSGTAATQNNISGTPSSGNGSTQAGEIQSRRPVEQVTWYQILVFCNKLSTWAGLTPAYEMQPSSAGNNGDPNTPWTTDVSQWGNVPTSNIVRWNEVRLVANSTGYRLPTASQWDHAYRTGTTTTYYWGNAINTDYLWYNANSNNRTHEVGLRLPNAYDLYDMSGNVYEWLWDWYETGNFRLYRGGSFSSSETQVNPTYSMPSQSSSYRLYSYQGRNDIGFRIIRPTNDPPPPLPPPPDIAQVLISYANPASNIYMSKHEITQIEYQNIMLPVSNGISATPSYFTTGVAAGEVQQRRPVEQVSWYEAIVFCNRLSLRAGLTPAYEMQVSSAGDAGNTTAAWTTDYTQWGNVPTTDVVRWKSVRLVTGSTGYRLPTSAQFNNAYIGGKRLQTGYYYWGAGNTINGDFLWYNANSGNKTHEVGKKLPNGYGLYDMAGNVAEWVWGTGSAASSTRSIYGGSRADVDGSPFNLTYGYSQSMAPQTKNNSYGFRIVRPTTDVPPTTLPEVTLEQALVGGHSAGNFYMGKYEVTQEEWQKVMTPISNDLFHLPSEYSGVSGKTPNAGEVQARRPVEMISWYDALVFCNRLSELHGLTPAYRVGGSTDYRAWGNVPVADSQVWNQASIVAGSTGYRMPTQSQWEYAYRAGTKGTYYWGNVWDDNLAWTSSTTNYGSRTHEVGKKVPNGYGLYDMAGNVWEWCQENVSSSNNRYLRGASWYENSGNPTATMAANSAPQTRNSRYGLRVIRPTTDAPPPRPSAPPTTIEKEYIPYGGAITPGVYGNFYMGKYPITQAEWQTVMGNTVQNGISATPSQFINNADDGEVQARRPVERISWYMAVVFCNRLSVKDGLTPAYGYNNSTTNTTTANWGTVATNSTTSTWNNIVLIPGATGYRLPTQVQWEFAYRGGTTTTFYWGNEGDGTTAMNNNVWYSRNSSSKTHEVGKKLPNGYGLYDMGGNVWEWTNDSNTVSYSNDRAFLRGGSYQDSSPSATSSTNVYKYYSYAYYGLRVMLPAQ